MTTAMLVVLAALTLVFNPVRVLAILMILTLLYFSTVPTVITISVIAISFYVKKRFF
jgi:hypothetical protein